MKITTDELRNGTLIYRNQQIMQILEFQALNETVHLKVMNFSTHKKQELDINAKETIEKITPDISKAELTSIEEDTYQFFDLDTYDMFEVDKSVAGDSMWMIEAQTCTLYSYHGEIYHVEAERYVRAKVVNIESGLMPIATLENGAKVNVDRYTRAGDTILVDTITLRQHD